MAPTAEDSMTTLQLFVLIAMINLAQSASREANGIVAYVFVALALVEYVRGLI